MGGGVPPPVTAKLGASQNVDTDGRECDKTRGSSMPPVIASWPGESEVGEGSPNSSSTLPVAVESEK